MAKEIRITSVRNAHGCKVKKCCASCQHKCIESVTMSIMEIVEKKVSAELFETLKDMLLGFDDAMQLEMADDLLDFAHGHVIHTTGCPSADYVLEMCYANIAAEHGILDGETIQNMLNQYNY